MKKKILGLMLSLVLLLTVLPQPARAASEFTFSWTGYKVSWDAIDGAMYYEYKLTKNGETLVDFWTESTSIDFSEQITSAGKYGLTVEAYKEFPSNLYFESKTQWFDFYQLTLEGAFVANSGSYGSATQCFCLEGMELKIRRNTPDAGKQFDGWSATGVTLTPVGGNSDDVTFTMPANDVTVKALWKDLSEYTVTLPSGTGYTAVAAEGSSSPVDLGGSYSFTVTIDAGYEQGDTFAVKANGTALTPDPNGVYTISNITAAQTITVEDVVSSTKLTPLVGEVSVKSPDTIYPATELSSIVLARTDTTVPGSLSLNAGQTLTVGTRSYNWTFTPNDTKNYETVTGAVAITVTADSLQSIAAAGTLAKTSYVYGEAFETAGLTVTATYASGLTKTVTEEVSFPALAAGQSAITLSYTESGVTKSCEVSGLTVSAKELSALTLEIAGGSVYNGQPQTPAVVLKEGDVVIPASEYTLSYSENILPGTATVTVTAKDGGNYAFLAQSRGFEIAKATLTVTAEDRLVAQGAAMPALTWRVVGLVGGDTFAAPSLATTAADTDTPGAYEITVAGGTLSNAECYDVVYVSGTLTVQAPAAEETGADSDIPGTGDSGRPALWLALAVLCGGALTGSLRLHRRKAGNR